MKNFTRELFRNGLAVLTILICGAGLAGSLIEQIDGSRGPPEESAPQTSFPAESQPGTGLLSLSLFEKLETGIWSLNFDENDIH